MNAYAYIRVSGAGQADGQGLGRQRDTINSYAASNNLSILEFFEDVHTGTADALDRPGFSQLVVALNGCRTIVVERLDRLARTVMVQEQAIVWLASHNIDLVVADTGENVTQSYMDDPMKRALIQMQAVFAELDKSMLVKKLAAARKKIREEKGKCEGQKAYGEVDKRELAIVSRIKDMRDDGFGYNRVAKALNALAIRTRSGGIWYSSGIRSICKGRVICQI